jgi:hypothetical protein
VVEAAGVPRDAPTMVCFTEATRRAPWRIRHGPIDVPVRHVVGALGGMVVLAPLGALLTGLFGSWNLLAGAIALGAVGGVLAVTSRPGGEPLPRHLWRALWARRGLVAYRGRRGRLYVGLCPVPPGEVARGDPVLLRRSAVEIDPRRVGARGEVLPWRGP